jgi:hypothetical protein
MSVGRLRPRVFVSSTVLDFVDLRSALRHWLEELGFEVAMSETADFPRQPDQDTFLSCLQAIESSDFYVLLMGTRVGSAYQPGVSVTRQEFRWAAELARQGRIKMMLFIRTEVMSALRERRAMSRPVSSPDPTAALPAGSTLQDPDQIQAFVDEIRTAPTVASEELMPRGGNWLYEFSSFRELTQALREGLRISGSVGRQTLLASLKDEIERNLATLIENTEAGLPILGHRHLHVLRSQIELNSTQAGKMLSLDEPQVSGLILFWTVSHVAQRLQDSALIECLRTGEFLEYDIRQGQVRSSLLERRLRELQSWIKRTDDRAVWLKSHDEEFTALAVQRHQGQQSFGVPEPALLAAFALNDSLENVVRLSVSLYRFITEPGSEVVDVPLALTSPYVDQVEGLAKEAVTTEAVRTWLTDPVISNVYLGDTSRSGWTREQWDHSRANFPGLEMIDQVMQREAEEMVARWLRGELEIPGLERPTPGSEG